MENKHGIKLADLDGLALEEFDPADYIASDEAAAAYITEALQTNDAAIFAAAVGDVARARGMSDIAKKSGLAREGLYKALRPDSQPRMETMTRVLQAMNVRLVAQVIAPYELSPAPAPAQTTGAKPPAKPAAKKAPARKTAAKRAPADT